jgi:probable F420-dependent oxidoreductase
MTEAGARPRIGVSFRGSDELCPRGIRDLVDYAVLADRLGFDDVDAADQILIEDRPDRMPSGDWRWAVDSDWPDPLAMLAGIAVATSSVTLTTSILLAPLRPAIATAKAASTIDQLSGGRLRLGVGAGWQRAEFDAVGLPLAGRTARMEDTVGAWRALWEQGPASFHSDTVSFTDVWSRPGPFEGRRIPVLFAGPPTDAVAERIARLGDGWNPLPLYRDQLAEGVARISAALEAAGRDHTTPHVRFPLAEPLVVDAYGRRHAVAVADEIARLRDVGVTDVKIYIAGVATRGSEVGGVLAWLAEVLQLSPR